MKSIQEIVEPEIRLVEDTEIRTYHESEPALESIQNSLETIMGQRWPTQAMYQFFKNWRNPAIGAGSFCALTCRLLEEADEQKPDSQAQRELLLSAARIAEVSYEDMGLYGPNHAELYEMLATAFCGSDEWKLQRYALPEATHFLTGAREYRERGTDMVRALMLSLVEELYNHGEFTFIAHLFKNWHDLYPEIDKTERRRHLRFIHEHVGGTESGHFANMTKGLVRYGKAHGLILDWQDLGKANCEYLQGTSQSFKRILDAMTASRNTDTALSATA